MVLWYKYFIGYLYNGNKFKPLNIMLPKTSPYVKSYDEQTEWMYYLIEDDNLLEKYNTIWDNVSADRINFISFSLFENQNKISCWWVTDFCDKKFLS